MKDRPSLLHVQMSGLHESIILYVFLRKMGVGLVPPLVAPPSASSLGLGDELDVVLDGFFVGGASSFSLLSSSSSFKAASSSRSRLLLLWSDCDIIVKRWFSGMKMKLDELVRLKDEEFVRHEAQRTAASLRCWCWIVVP